MSADAARTSACATGKLACGAQHRADAGADGAADVESGGQLWLLDLQFRGGFPQQLKRAPADHGDAGGADGVAFGNQTARSVDAAFAIRPRLSVHPVLRAAPRFGFANHFRSEERRVGKEGRSRWSPD